MIRLALVTCLLLGAPIALAAPAAGVSTWTIAGNNITLRYTFSKTLAAYLVPDRAAPPPVEKISEYVLSRVSVRQQGTTCASVDQGYDLGRADALYAGPGLTSFEILFHCPGIAGALTLRNDAFFELAAGQIGIADLRVNGGAPVTRVLTKGDTAININANQAPNPSWPTAFGGLGMRHALGSVLCLCTALGLALLARDQRRLLLAAGALSCGYGVASVAAGAGGLLLAPQASQAAGGALIALIAAQLTNRHTNRPGLAATGLAVAVALAAAVALLRGQGDAALALLGTGLFGTAVLAVSRDPTAGEAALLTQATVIGMIDGFALTTRFAPLRAFHTLGSGSLLAYNGGTLLGLVLMLSATLGSRVLLRHRTLKQALLGRDLLVATLAGAGAWSMLALP